MKRNLSRHAQLDLPYTPSPSQFANYASLTPKFGQRVACNDCRQSLTAWLRLILASPIIVCKVEQRSAPDGEYQLLADEENFGHADKESVLHGTPLGS